VIASVIALAICLAIICWVYAALIIKASRVRRRKGNA